MLKGKTGKLLLLKRLKFASLDRIDFGNVMNWKIHRIRNKTID
jgi:hypothetical protein